MTQIYSNTYFQVFMNKIYSCICNCRFQHINEISQALKSLKKHLIKTKGEFPILTQL